jgi:hypothetical protein
MPSAVHIGKKIKEVLSKSPMTVVDFADKINKTRTVVYDIFISDSIDSVLLSRISKVLNYNFFQYYSSEKLSEEKDAYASKQDRYQEMMKELKETRKELKELKKQNLLLEKLVLALERKNQKNTRL